MWSTLFQHTHISHFHTRFAITCDFHLFFGNCLPRLGALKYIYTVGCLSCIWTHVSRYLLIYWCRRIFTIIDDVDYAMHNIYRERKCPDTIGTVPVPWAGHFNAKLLIYFWNKIYGSNFIKRTRKLLWFEITKNVDCSLRKKVIVSFIVIFGKLSFHVRRLFSAVPESLRWLVVQARYDEARQVLRRICCINGTTMPNSIDLRLLETVSVSPTSL